ncbi:hypothetical protein [Microvirga puerhi]|uniref:Uncharacterized protein n=1 Tax=Microvirga puerhi TaxID=2876078 RepID=A0ABS7VLW8_9HYPH|nr:hypothetical protein [Microvirga puerhi]MBZ6076528.1 hypothetical protein [Microvirga puerhi]
MKWTPHLISAFLPLFLAMPAGNASAGQGAQSWFLEQGYVPPEKGQIIACHGYGCARRTAVPVDATLIHRASAILKSAKTSPETERRALGEVVKLYTSYLATQFGSPPDTPKSPPSKAGVSGQMDCVDETANTTSLLLILQDNGLLAFHEVERPQSRGLFLDGRYPHTTAIISEKANHRKWAVDPWAKAPGERPDILPLSQWRQDS